MQNTKMFKTQYHQPNYKVIENSEGECCFIYFSGNGIFDPDTIEAFENVIVKKNRYEWAKWKANADKEIYIRDIHKEWYFKGINDQYNTIEKVYGLLKELTQGYRIVTVGSSAGGYAAVLFGTLLQAERIFAFSAQFDLVDWITPRKLIATKAFVEQKQYIDICDLVRASNSRIFYFYPACVKVDVVQAELVKDIKNVYTFAIKSKLHGKALYTNTIKDVLTLDENKLIALCRKFKNKKISPFRFALSTSTVKAAFVGLGYNTIKPIYYKLNDLRRRLPQRR